MFYEDALYALVNGTGLTLTVDNGIVDEASFVSNVTFFADANDPRIPSWAQIQVKQAELKAAEPMRVLREKRNLLLAETDWWAVQDLIMTQAQKDYRQALRDITIGLDTVEKVNAVTWPTKPE